MLGIQINNYVLFKFERVRCTEI